MNEILWEGHKPVGAWKHRLLFPVLARPAEHQRGWMQPRVKAGDALALANPWENVQRLLSPARCTYRRQGAARISGLRSAPST